MRLWICLAAACAAVAAPAKADDAADIRRLEAQWGQAFLANDYAAIERIVAPEFKLMRVEAGRPEFTGRARWLGNSRQLTFQEFEAKVTDVIVAGRTAVATVDGRWKVSRGHQSRDERFIVSDTWVKRNGRWTAVFRHSSPVTR